MKQLLNDPQQQPTDEVLQSIMGTHYAYFEALRAHLSAQRITMEWNYYRDGKSWLCKAQRGNKTVLWLSVWEDCFRLSFFFTEKTRAGVEQLPIDPKIKADFQTQKASGKLLPLILDVREEETLNHVAQIVKYKIS